MSINRYNYQEFFSLYIDNELKVAERKAVEDFIRHNQDLEEELLMLKQSILKPDVEVTFDNKEILLQFDKEANPVNSSNFSEYAVAYADDELSEFDKAHLEAVVLNNPHLQHEFDLIKTLKLQADDFIVLPDKKLLYHYERGRKPVMLVWGSMAAAAIILLFAGWLWLHERPASFVSTYFARTTKPVPLKSSDTGTKSEKETSHNSGNRTDAVIDPSANYESMAVLEKKSSGINKRARLQSKKPGHIISREYNIESQQQQDSATAFINRINDHQDSPKSAHIGNRSPAETISKSEVIAAIDGAIEKANKRIADQPVVKINAVNNHDYTAAVTVAHTENEENILPGDIDRSNSLRGILRKASRFIDKNTTSRTSKKSGLVIGNLEIAFQ